MYHFLTHFLCLSFCGLRMLDAARASTFCGPTAAFRRLLTGGAEAVNRPKTQDVSAVTRLELPVYTNVGSASECNGSEDESRAVLLDKLIAGFNTWVTVLLVRYLSRKNNCYPSHVGAKFNLDQ